MNRTLIKGFTLIELLIVVAIIAILAAIAVPNFLEAQTRAKVARVKADMRSVATGLETYHIDTNSYVYQNPQCRALRHTSGQAPVLESLTTPIAYMNSVSSFSDPFKPKAIVQGPNLDSPGDEIDQSNPTAVFNYQLYRYYARNDTNPSILPPAGNQPQFLKKPLWYIFGSAGPDGITENLNPALTTRPDNTDTNRAFFLDKAIYDATNGTVSNGSVYRVGGVPTGAGSSFYHAAATAN